MYRLNDLIAIALCYFKRFLDCLLRFDGEIIEILSCVYM